MCREAGFNIIEDRSALRFLIQGVLGSVDVLDHLLVL